MQPRDQKTNAVEEFVREVPRTFAAYIRGQLLISLVTIGLYAAAFALLKAPVWFLLGVICGILHLIPNLGAALGLLIAVGITWAAGREFWRVAAVAGTSVAILGFESFYLTPRILGRELSLSPLVVFLALLIGGAVFGFWGLLLAAPLAAILNLLWTFARRRR